MLFSFIFSAVFLNELKWKQKLNNCAVNYLHVNNVWESVRAIMFCLNWKLVDVWFTLFGINLKHVFSSMFVLLSSVFTTWMMSCDYSISIIIVFLFHVHAYRHRFGNKKSSFSHYLCFDIHNLSWYKIFNESSKRLFLTFPFYVPQFCMHTRNTYIHAFLAIYRWSQLKWMSYCIYFYPATKSIICVSTS